MVKVAFVVILVQPKDFKMQKYVTVCFATQGPPSHKLVRLYEDCAARLNNLHLRRVGPAPHSLDAVVPGALVLLSLGHPVLCQAKQQKEEF